MKSKLIKLFLIVCAYSSAQVVNIPDVNFKKCLLENDQINTNGDDEIQLSEAESFKGNIDCSIPYFFPDDEKIKDLTGIEVFKLIEELSIAGNLIEEIVLSENKELVYLDCDFNMQVKKFDLSNNTKLNFLSCIENNLTSIDVSENPNLKHLRCSYNPISELDISNNPLLDILRCRFTDVSNIDFSRNTVLREIHISDTNITTFQMANYDTVETLFCGLDKSENESFFNEPIKKMKNLKTLVYQGYGYTTLDLSNNLKLNFLGFGGIHIKDPIDISFLKELTDLYMGRTQLETIDLSHHPKLRVAVFLGNKFKTLDVSKNEFLRRLSVNDNQITSLDLSKNKFLNQLDCTGNKLTYLNVANGINEEFIQFSAVGNPDLKCINIDEDFVPDTKWSKDDVSEYSSDCPGLSTEDDFVLSNSLKLYPNPTNDIVTISSKQPIKEVIVYNIFGSKMLESKKTMINLSNLPSGLYILDVETQLGEQMTSKIVKK